MAIKTEMEMAMEGEFLRQYGSKYGVSTREQLSIGRIRWDMFPIGKHGVGAIVYYMKNEEMFALATDILNGTFARRIAAETTNYPTAYQYATGKDAHLHLNIGKSKAANSCCIQMQDATAKTQYLMGVSMTAMYDMARKYMLCTGAMPVQSGSYFESVMKAFEKGRADRIAKFGKVVVPEDDIDEPVVPTVDEEAPAKQPAPKKTEQPKEKTEAPKVEAAEYTVVVNGKKTMDKGFYKFPATLDNAPVTLLFKKEEAEKMKWFAEFENQAAIKPTNLNLVGEKNGKFILFKSVQKKKT